MAVPVAASAGAAARFRERHGMTQVALLASMGRLGPRLVACHGAGLSREDGDLVAGHGTALVHTPVADLTAAAGLAPVPALIEAGCRVGLGTGGPGRCHDLDLFRSMDITAKIHKVFSRNPEVMDARTVSAMATIDGARALGLSGTVGSLTPGKRADLIVVDTSALHMRPLYNPFSHLVYAASGKDVSLVVIDGRVVVEDGRLVVMDPGPVMARARAMGLVSVKGDDGEDLESG
jgi:5-methylthioadenosine/S-adenosylhomocysteine deaminase